MTGPAGVDDALDEQARYGDPVPMVRIERAAAELRAWCGLRAVQHWPAMHDVLAAVAGAFEYGVTQHRELGHEARRIHPTFRAALEAVERLVDMENLDRLRELAGGERP